MNLMILLVDVIQMKIKSQHNNIRGIPSILIFKDGEEIERLRGESKTFYSDKLKYYLSVV